MHVCLQAQQKMDTQNLARQKLNGQKTTTSEAYQDEHSAYLLTSPPTERELFIIRKPICASFMQMFYDITCRGHPLLESRQHAGCNSSSCGGHGHCSWCIPWHGAAGQKLYFFYLTLCGYFGTLNSFTWLSVWCFAEVIKKKINDFCSK